MSISGNWITKRGLSSFHTIDEYFAFVLGMILFFLTLSAFGDASAFAEPFPEGTSHSAYSSPVSHHHHRSVSDSISLAMSQVGGGANSPVAHHRSISDSMALTANYGRAANSHFRSISEQITLSIETPPSSANQQLRTLPSPYSPSFNQRIDEKFGQRVLLGNKGDTHVRSTSTVEQQGSFTSTEGISAEIGSMSFQEVATTLGNEEGTEADDSSHIEYYYAVVASGTFSIVVVVVVVLGSAVKSEKKNRHVISFCLYFIINRSRRVISSLMVFVLVMSITIPVFGIPVSAFGNDYRPLTTVSPGEEDDTSTVISVDIIDLLEDGTGTYIVDPYSTSSVRGTPSTTSLSGFGWRTAELAGGGSTIPAGSWSFTVRANSNPLSTGAAVARVYVYSTDILGSDVLFIGTDTGSVNLFNTLALGTVQTDTLTFSAPTIDLTNRILVVEYWIDVTSSPLLDVMLTFRAGSSNQWIDVPPDSSVDYYLGSMLHSVTLSESAAISDDISLIARKVISDSAVTTDSISIAATKRMSDSVAITDTIRISVAKPLADNMAFNDNLSRSYDALSQSFEQIIVTDTMVSVAAFSRPSTEQFDFTDAVTIAVSKTMVDQFAVSDTSAKRVVRYVSISEELGMTDAVVTPLVITRAVSDILAMTDMLSGSPAISIAIIESMAIDDQFSDISATFSLTLGELLVIAQGFATDFEGIFDQIGNEGIIVGDSVVLILSSVMSPSESMTIQDQVLAFQTPGRALIDSMKTRDSIVILVMRPPPPSPSAITTMPNLFIAETKNVSEFKDLTDPIKATNIDGIWNIDELDKDGLETLLQDIGMPVYDIEEEAASGDVHNLTIVLPTFKVGMEGKLSNGEAFLTPTLSSLPAGMGVRIPIDVKSSVEGAANLDLLNDAKVSFTPSQNTANFAMLITILDNNPEEDITQEPPPNDLPAFFIDVTIVGDFTSLTPDTEDFFEELPQVTFTVTEEWADEQNAERDSNNVPIVDVFLLDESDGTWIELTEEVEPPTSAIDGTYTYTATLPHFSTYVVTTNIIDPEESDGSADDNAASSSSSSSSAGGGRSGRTTTIVNPVVESESPTTTTNPGISLPSQGKIVIKDITDSFALNILAQNPLPQRVITVQNVTVAVNVLDVKMAGLFEPAVAVLNFEITNRGNLAEVLTIRYWYLNSGGETVFDKEYNVTINAGVSIIQTIEVPFNSAGVYDVIIEARIDDQSLASTDIAIEVPWLATNLLIVVVAAIAVIFASAVYLIFMMRIRSRK